MKRKKANENISEVIKKFLNLDSFLYEAFAKNFNFTETFIDCFFCEIYFFSKED